MKGKKKPARARKKISRNPVLTLAAAHDGLALKTSIIGGGSGGTGTGSGGALPARAEIIGTGSGGTGTGSGGKASK